jgi:hypothetical protein
MEMCIINLPISRKNRSTKGVIEEEAGCSWGDGCGSSGSTNLRMHVTLQMKMSIIESIKQSDGENFAKYVKPSIKVEFKIQSGGDSCEYR